MEEMETLYLVLVLTIGACFAIFGLILYKRPPKKINALYGYRTKRSMSDQKLWDFSQRYSGKLMFTAGVISVIAGMAVWLMFTVTLAVLVLVAIVQIVMVFATFPLVERGMKRMT
ncbi:MAG: SdpI family protein [Methanomassiliicoccaceae archaeon]|nr:SdpI family protein [Methanomassiliicoccaceae archaeon]